MDAETRSVDAIIEQTVLVASHDEELAGVVSGFLARTALRAGFPLEAEPAWLSFTRVQPRLLVCDGRDSGADDALLVVEATARRVPVLLLVPVGGADAWSETVATHHLATLEFPVGAPVFNAAVNALLDDVAQAPSAAPLPLVTEPVSALDAAGDEATQRGYPDWRRRLRRNLSRASDARWDPLTHAIDRPIRE